MSLDGLVNLVFSINDRQTVGVNASADNRPASVNDGYTFADGAGALAGNELFHDLRTLGGSSEGLDLAGTLKNPYGNNAVFARIKGLYVKNLSASNTLTIGADGTAPWATLLGATGTIVLNPGAAFCWVDPTAGGATVTAATGDILKVAGTTGERYKVAILGATT